MKSKSTFFGYLNIFARVFGLFFTAAGAYFAAWGIYYLLQPAVPDLRDTLGFPPSYRPFLIASLLLIVGVHFIRGEAHRPDLPGEKKPDRSLAGRTHSWWTGEPLEHQPDREQDT